MSTIKSTKTFMRLGLKLIIIFTRATPKPAHSKDCGPLPENVENTCSNKKNSGMDIWLSTAM
jgi:hypothetical protein